MTSHTDLGPAQKWFTVLRAELRRHLSSRKLVVRVVLMTALAMLGGLAVLAFVAAFDPEGVAGATGSLPTALETTGGIAAILLGLNALAVATAETADGTVLSSLLMVPDRRRLLTARAAATMVIAAVVGLMAAAVVLVCGLLITGGTILDPGLLAACLGATVVAASLTTLLGFLAGTAVRHGAAAMAMAMVGLLVLPLGVGAVQFAAPAVLGPLLDVLLTATPGVAVVQAVSVAVTQPGTLPAAVTGVSVLLVWVVVTALVARGRFQREGSAACKAARQAPSTGEETP